MITSLIVENVIPIWTNKYFLFKNVMWPNNGFLIWLHFPQIAIFYQRTDLLGCCNKRRYLDPGAMLCGSGNKKCYKFKCPQLQIFLDLFCIHAWFKLGPHHGCFNCNENGIFHVMKQNNPSFQFLHVHLHRLLRGFASDAFHGGVNLQFF